MGENGILIFAVILSVICIGLLNFFGQAVTKYINAVTRSVVNAVRTTIVWLVGIIITVAQPQDDPALKDWEKTEWQSILLELSGFFFLIMALIIHRSLIKFPYKGRWFHEIVVPCDKCKCNKQLRELMIY